MPTKLSSRISKTTTIDGRLKTPSPHPAQVENDFITTMENIGKKPQVYILSMKPVITWNA